VDQVKRGRESPERAGPIQEQVEAGPQDPPELSLVWLVVWKKLSV
jgi:hypothetical protein